MKDPSPHTRSLDASVVVTVYDQPDTLRPILQSLTQQDTLSTYEIVVSDDGSDGQIHKVVSEEALTTAIPIRYIWQQDRLFRAGQARNNAIRLSSGKILIFLDGDCIPPPSFVREHLSLHDQQENLLVAGGRLFCKIETCRDLLKERPPLVDVLTHLKATAWENTDEETYRRRWLTTENPWKAGFSYNISAPYSNELYFDENFLGWGIEDWELCYRLWKNGHVFNYVPGISVWHLDIPELVCNVFRLSDHDGLVRFAKNALYFLDKYSDDPSLLDCTLAFRCYELNLDTNRWYWDLTHENDDPKDYRIEEGILKLRIWLGENPSA